MRGPSPRRNGRRGHPYTTGSAEALTESGRLDVDAAAVAAAVAHALARIQAAPDAAVAIGRVLEDTLPALGAEFALAVDGKGLPIASATASGSGLRFAVQETEVILAAGDARSAGTSRTVKGDVTAFPMRSGAEAVGVVVLQARDGADRAGFNEGAELLADCLAEIVSADRAKARRTPMRATGRGDLSARLIDAVAGHRDGVALFGPDNGLIAANPAFAAAHGAAVRALKGLTLAEILRRSDDGYAPVLIAQNLAEGEAGVDLAMSADGRWLRLSRQRTADGDELVLQSPADEAMARVAASRRRILAASSEAERFEAIWNALPVGALLIGRDGRVADANLEAVRLLGRPRDKLAGVRLGRIVGAAGEGWQVVSRGSEEFQLAVRAQALDEDRSLVALAELPAQRATPEEMERGRRAVAATEALGELGHEMRTPLNAVIGFADIMLARSFGPINDRQDQYLRDISGAGRHLLEMVEHMFDHAQLTTGRYSLHQEWLSFDTLAAEALRLLEPIAQADGVGLHGPNGPAIEIYMDRRGLLQALINLLTNAVKFTPRGGEARVGAALDGDDFIITVADTGEGIRPEDLSRVTEPFTQARRLGARPLKGAGLGLSIVRAITELHGGAVHIASEPGKGTEVSMVLPASLARPAGPTSAA